MSRKTPEQWLLSHHSGFNPGSFANLEKKSKKTKTIAISSGKGGVGKTSVAIKMAKLLVEKGEKVLLVDCDYNLSNTAVKLGIPLDSKFYELFVNNIEFEDAVYKDGNFHLLSACNGSLELFDRSLGLENLIVDILESHKSEYDTIILDCPAGLNKEVAILNTYCDYRFVVVTPDRSSITDSYSLIKVLGQRHSLKSFHLIFNKISGRKQYNRLTETFLKTSAHYLDCRLKVLGGIPFYNEQVDQFDRELLKVADSNIHNSFYKVMQRFSEEDRGNSLTESPIFINESLGSFKPEHEVHSI
jgi:flagellar biosynthesis protein FlhG